MITDTLAIPGYQIVRQLGQGGTATVYLAIQNSFGREVALKIMSPLLNQDPAFATRFLREAHIVSQMHHASIVPVFDVGQHQHHHYLSMELLPGGDLRQCIVSGKCHPAFAISLCRAMASALELAHRKGFVHRDIKPQNILFREDGAPVLTDFGIARAIDIGSSLTAAGMFVGTPNYMSPEQVKGLELDGRSDLYSLGIVFYEMLTGKVPFNADSALSIALKHLSDPLPLLPPELAAYQSFLDQLTVKDREQRFANSNEVIRALARLEELPAAERPTVLRALPDEIDTARYAAPTMMNAPPARRSRQWLSWAAPWAGGLIAVAIVAGLAVTMTQRDLFKADAPTASATQAGLLATVPTIAAPASATASAPRVASTGQAITQIAPAADPPESQSERTRRAEAEPRAREIEAANRRQQQIAALLANARTNLASGALVEPPMANAADQYRAVLQLQPGHPEALTGLQQVADAVVTRVERSRKAGEYDSALQLLAQARSIRADHPRIARLQSDLEERKEKQRLQAQEHLEAAGKHIAKAQIYLDRMPVTLRNVAEANDHFDKASELASSVPDLDATRERILAGYAIAAQGELTAKKFERALKVLTYARKRNMSSPLLDQLEMQISQQTAGR